MTSIRNLKKQIKTLTENLKDECLISLALHPEANPAAIAEVIGEIDRIGSELLFRVNHCNYRPSDLSAKKFINTSLSEAENKMGKILEKMHDMTR